MDLKLRAWDDVLGEMLYSRLEQFDDSLMFRFSKHFETDKPIYMRPTGLKAKNGVEIWEGDVCQAEFPNGAKYVDAIGFSNAEFTFMGNRLSFSMVNMQYGMTIEVIGNIYANPELLPQGHRPTE